MNEERIYLTDYIEKMRTAYKQARAAFEVCGTALEKEQTRWKQELERGWRDYESRRRDQANHERKVRELKEKLRAVEREAKAEFAELIEECSEVFGRHFRTTPEQIDEKGLALLNSGVMTAKELLALVNEYPENYTMRKLIGAKIEELGEKKHDQELSYKGRMLKFAPTTHDDAMKNAVTWAELALRSNEIELSASMDKHVDGRIDEIVAKVQGYSIPKYTPTQNTATSEE
mgnify:CR=1 FL=1